MCLSFISHYIYIFINHYIHTYIQNIHDSYKNNSDSFEIRYENLEEWHREGFWDCMFTLEHVLDYWIGCVMHTVPKTLPCATPSNKICLLHRQNNYCASELVLTETVLSSSRKCCLTRDYSDPMT